MDKVFITKEQLTQSIQKRQESAGPFLLSLVWIWFFTSVILFCNTCVSFDVCVTYYLSTFFIG